MTPGIVNISKDKDNPVWVHNFYLENYIMNDTNTNVWDTNLTFSRNLIVQNKNHFYVIIIPEFYHIGCFISEVYNNVSYDRKIFTFAEFNDFIDYVKDNFKYLNMNMIRQRLNEVFLARMYGSLVFIRIPEDLFNYFKLKETLQN